MEPLSNTKYVSVGSAPASSPAKCSSLCLRRGRRQIYWGPFQSVQYALCCCLSMWAWSWNGQSPKESMLRTAVQPTVVSSHHRLPLLFKADAQQNKLYQSGFFQPLGLKISFSFWHSRQGKRFYKHLFISLLVVIMLADLSCGLDQAKKILRALPMRHTSGLAYEHFSREDQLREKIFPECWQHHLMGWIPKLNLQSRNLASWLNGPRLLLPCLPTCRDCDPHTVSHNKASITVIAY